MDIRSYLKANDETMAQFSRRSGVKVATLQVVAAQRSRCRIDVAQAIVKASEAQPAPCGGTIDYDSLVPDWAAPQAFPEIG